MNLLKHLEYMRMVFLASQGDFFTTFHLNVFTNDFMQTARDSSIHFLNSQLGQSLTNPDDAARHSHSN
jgi:hypothetical protein